ncbi:MAG: M23 family metallopeptidase [Burkholderiales bacterium]|nr:M23 family metallopeptidase [Burkholderiales bacterium]
MIVVILVAVLQLALPVAALAWLGRAKFTTRAETIAAAGLTGAWLVAIGLAGFWFILPQWLLGIYAIAWVLCTARAWSRARHRPPWPARNGARARLVVSAIAMLGCIALWNEALTGRRAPDTETVELEFPLRDGRFVVANGGSTDLVNSHVDTLDDPRFAPVRGQSYALDIVEVNALGVRAPAPLPGDPARYVIFGRPVHAPCAGVVSQIENTLSDLSPPQTDPRNPAGNRVIIDCGGFTVLLAHLKRGSVTVTGGQRIAAGAIVGAVGNSGNTDEPHLHVHAQRPGRGILPLDGEPLGMRFGGRWYVRNDRVRAP